MKKLVILTMALTMLASCGGGFRAKPTRIKATANAAQPFASGPISKACMSSDRKARSRALCGCIQAIADQTLSAGDQRMAAGFYGDPHRAQEIRQSDRSSHERFWQSYKDYAQTAAAVCG